MSPDVLCFKTKLLMNSGFTVVMDIHSAKCRKSSSKPPQCSRIAIG
jgi:hypothetical protein